MEVGIDGEHHRLVFALDDALGTVKYFSKIVKWTCSVLKEMHLNLFV